MIKSMRREDYKYRCKSYAKKEMTQKPINKQVHMRIDFIKFLSVIALSISTFLEIIDEKQEQEKEKEKEKKKEIKITYKHISIFLTILYFLYMLMDMFCANGIIISILPLIQRYWYIIFLYVLIAAIAPSVVAKIELKKGTFNAEKDYVSQNRKLNLYGAAAACASFLVAYIIIGDFGTLEAFYIDDIIPTVASVCIWMTLIYQKTEQKKERAGELDHSAKLKHINQILNLLHLFNVYFLSIVSVIYIVAYTIYCQIYHMGVAIDIWCLFLLSVILAFFYKLSQHKYQYLYIISIIIVPIILISSIYWMTWIAPSREMRISQIIFIIIHSLLYIFFIFKHEGIISIEHVHKDEAIDPKEKGGYKIGRWHIICRNYYLLIFPLIITILYIIVGRLPSAIERLPAYEAYNYIDMICTDTNLDTGNVIEKIKELNIYNETDDSYDIRGFMRFLSEELDEQLLEKKIIEKQGEIPTRDILENIYMKEPRHKVEK